MLRLASDRGRLVAATHKRTTASVVAGAGAKRYPDGADVRVSVRSGVGLQYAALPGYAGTAWLDVTGELTARRGNIISTWCSCHADITGLFQKVSEARDARCRRALIVAAREWVEGYQVDF